MAERLGLQDLIYQVKDDLLAPNPKRQDPHPELRVDTIELEIGVGVTREKGGNIQVWVLQYGEKISSETTQRVRVRLSPVRQGGEFKIFKRKGRSDEPFPPLHYLR